MNLPSPTAREGEWIQWLIFQWKKATGKEAMANYRLPSGSVVDILTDETAYAVARVDDHILDCVGHALYGAVHTYRLPGVILLMPPKPDSHTKLLYEKLASVVILGRSALSKPIEMVVIYQENGAVSPPNTIGV